MNHANDETSVKVRRPRRRLIHALGILLLAGCAATPGTPSVDQDEKKHPDFDPDRSLLPLSRIEPDPPAPNPATPDIAELSPDGVRRLSRARQLYGERRYTEASLELDKALRKSPDHPDLHRMMAMTLFASGQPERVRAHLRKAVDARDDDIVVHYLLGRLASENAEYQEAIRQFRIALKASDAGEQPAYAALAHFYLAKALNGERYLTAAIESYRAYESAVAQLSSEARSQPDLASLLQINGGKAQAPISVAYEKLGQYAEAASALESSVNDDAVDPATRERLARLLLRANRSDDALRHARRLIEDGESTIDLLAEIHEAAGQPQRVIDDVRALYEAHPERNELLLAYVDVLVRYQRLDDAEVVLRGALSGAAETSTRVYWQLCDLLIERGKWDDLLAVAADALRSSTDSYETAQQKVSAAARDGHAVRALLDRADAQRTDFATSFLLASLAREIEAAQQEKAWLQRTIEDKPGFTPARVDLGELLLNEYRWEDVIALVQADADAFERDARLQRLCGQAYAGLDRVADAEKHLQAAIQLNRADTQAAECLAELLRRHDQPRRAMRQYESILEVNPLHESAREALFEMLLFDLERDRKQDAAAQLAELNRLSASPHRIARCTARLSLRTNEGPPDWEKYRKTLNEAIAESGPDARTYELISRSYLQQDEPEAALASIEKGLELEPNDAELRVGYVSVLNALLDYEEAISEMRRLVDRHPNRGEWVDRLWTILIIDHRFEEAQSLVSRRLDDDRLADNDRAKYRGFLADTLLRAKAYDELIERLRAWREDDPGRETWTERLLEAYGRAERFDDAIALARELFEADPNGNTRQGLRNTYLAAERFDQAQQLVLAELEEDPASEELHRLLITTLMFSERHDDALALLENARTSTRYDLGTRELEINVLQHAGRFDEAIKQWQRWIRDEHERLANLPEGTESPILQALHFRLGRCYLLSGRLDDAVLNLRKWADESEGLREKKDFLSLLSTCYQQRDQARKAVESLQEAYALGAPISRDPGLNNDLGYSMTDLGMNLEMSERMIRYALVRDPENGAFLDSYGWVLYKEGRFAEARHWLEKAANTLEGDDPVVYDHLGDAVWRLGDSEAAIANWKDAIRFVDERLEDGDRPDLRRIRETVTRKLAAAEAGDEPEVAPVGPAKNDEETADDVSGSPDAP